MTKVFIWCQQCDARIFSTFGSGQGSDKKSLKSGQVVLSSWMLQRGSAKETANLL